MLIIDPLTTNDIERHITFVESDPDFRALRVENRRSNDPLYMVCKITKNKYFFELYSILAWW